MQACRDQFASDILFARAQLLVSARASFTIVHRSTATSCEPIIGFGGSCDGEAQSTLT